MRLGTVFQPEQLLITHCSLLIAHYSLLSVAQEVVLDRFYLVSDYLCAFKIEVAVMVNHLDESLDFTLGFFLLYIFDISFQLFTRQIIEVVHSTCL